MSHQYLGLAIGRLRRGRVNGQFAKETPERLVLVMVERLVAEEDDKIFHQRVVHFLELLIAERTRQVDSADFRADMRRQLSDLDRLVGHPRSFRVSRCHCKRSEAISRILDRSGAWRARNSRSTAW